MQCSSVWERLQRVHSDVLLMKALVPLWGFELRAATRGQDHTNGICASGGTFLYPPVLNMKQEDSQIEV